MRQREWLTTGPTCSTPPDSAVVFVCSCFLLLDASYCCQNWRNLVKAISAFLVGGGRRHKLCCRTDFCTECSSWNQCLSETVQHWCCRLKSIGTLPAPVIKVMSIIRQLFSQRQTWFLNKQSAIVRWNRRTAQCYVLPSMPRKPRECI